MSKQTINQTTVSQSRRKFLKGAAYTSALSISGMSTLAFAMNSDKAITADKTAGPVSSFTDSDVSVMQQQMLHKETVSLFNKSDDVVMLDAMKPVSIERVNGSLVIKPNIVTSAAFSGMIMMQAGQRISFDIQTSGSIFSSAEIQDVTKLDGQLLHITSEYSGFNQLIPVSNSDSLMS